MEGQGPEEDAPWSVRPPAGPRGGRSWVGTGGTRSHGEQKQPVTPAKVTSKLQLASGLWASGQDTALPWTLQKWGEKVPSMTRPATLKTVRSPL